MEAAEPAQANRLVERFDGSLVLACRRERIARGEDVARIEADAEPLRGGNQLQNPRQVLKTMTERGPLPRCRLQQRTNVQPRQALMHLVECPGDPLQADFFAA